MEKKKLKFKKVRRQKRRIEIKPALKYALVSFGFVCVLALLIVFHFLFRSGRINLTDDYRKELLQLQSSYRSATAIVEATCISSNKDSNGKEYSYYVINEVLSGEKSGLQKDMTIIVNSYDKVGEKHIIYIKSEKNRIGPDVVYNVVDSNNYCIERERIILNSNNTVPYKLFKEHIEKLRKEILMPSVYYYFRSFSSLVKNSDVIVIGRIISVETEEKVTCLIMESGEEQKRSLEVTTFEIEILNGLNSGKKYGDRIVVKMPQEGSIQTVDFITNKNFFSDNNNYQIEKENICIFFLTECKDYKEPMYFLINEYQGYIRTNGDYIYPCEENTPFKDYFSLSDAVNSIIKEKNG